MMESKTGFSDDYPMSASTPSSQEQQAVTQYIPSETAWTTIDSTKYGLAKPKRIVIKAKIANDQS